MSDIFTEWAKRSEVEKAAISGYPSIKPWQLWLVTSFPVRAYFLIQCAWRNPNRLAGLRIAWEILTRKEN